MTRPPDAGAAAAREGEQGPRPSGKPKKVKKENPLQVARRFVLEQGGFLHPERIVRNRSKE